MVKIKKLVLYSLVLQVVVSFEGLGSYKGSKIQHQNDKMMKVQSQRGFLLALLVAVLSGKTTMAFLSPSNQHVSCSSSSSKTALEARTHRGGRILNNRNNYGINEIGANSIGMGTYGSPTASSITRAPRRSRETGVREVGPNAIGSGEYGGGRGNIRSFQNSPLMRGSNRRGSYFPSPGRFDSPVHSSSYSGFGYGGSGNSAHGTIQGGGSRKTFTSTRDDPMVVELGSDSDRPIETEVELWQGPDNTPHRMRFYSQNGSMRPLRAMVDTTSTSGYGGTMQVRNTGPMEFPMSGSVASGGYGYDSIPAAHPADSITIQGGSLRTMSVNGDVDAVRVDLETQGLPLMATIELWQGPGEAMQVGQVYNDCGRPFSMMIDTPYGYGSTVAIRNEGPMEFPIEASISY